MRQVDENMRIYARLVTGRAESESRLYRLVRAVGRFWVWFLFRRVEARHRERVPARGPVLLCMNHPNNFIDSLLVGAVLPRQVHFLATAALFRNAAMARFLRACGAIPVYRRQDDPDRMERHTEMLAACLEALREGRLIGIYPEGTTHAEARVQRIKTGAARLALAFEAWRRDAPGTGPPLALIPVGLNFETRKSFRGHVLLAFGEPIPVPPHLASYRDDPGKAVEALTGAIQAGLEAQVIHVERLEAAELIRAIEALYHDDLIRQLAAARGLAAGAIDGFRLSRTVVEAVHHFETRDPERVERLAERIRRYRARLRSHGVRDQAVRARRDAPPTRHRLRSSARALLGLPLFAYGAVLNGLPYLLPRWLARRMVRKETDYATVRLLASMVAFPVFWGLETWVVWRWTGAFGATLFALSLPLSGLLAYHYLHGLGRFWSQLRFGVVALRHRYAASRLVAEREAIVAELERAKTEFLAATRGPRDSVTPS